MGQGMWGNQPKGVCQHMHCAFDATQAGQVKMMLPDSPGQTTVQMLVDTLVQSKCTGLGHTSRYLALLETCTLLLLKHWRTTAPGW